MTVFPAAPVDLPEGAIRIVKVQRPPDGRGADASWIVFARGTEHFRRLPGNCVPPEMRSAVGYRKKAYFLAQVHSGEWRLLHEITDQDW